jgi:hypothetical protein
VVFMAHEIEAATWHFHPRTAESTKRTKHDSIPTCAP